MNIDTATRSPFTAFAADVGHANALRAAIDAAYRRPEPDCLPPLIEASTLTPEERAAAKEVARKLVTGLRASQKKGGVEALVREYALSSEEGVALMCLAEALLRIPDSATRDALIRDKIGGGDWRAHLGQSPSIFVNAATWGLIVTGTLTSTSSEATLSSALRKLISRGGEPVIRRGVDLAMRMLGEQFVTGRTIGEALARARHLEEKGYRYSYDMLGEAAMTEADAERYFASYRSAIEAIGAASAGRGIIEGPGISIKLSALHPRYARTQRDRVADELYPRLRTLAVLARRFDIGLNIDAEEADRLDISLGLLERLCKEPKLAGWNGIGFVIQAYQKRAPFVIDFVVDLARRTGHRLMVRLVKGAYWDSEIKRAQLDGLPGYPVYTRKVHTDVSYLACARKLLDAPDAVFPQFATHNAMTVAAVYRMADPAKWSRDQYEFQCLHGMGEPLYDQVIGKAGLDRPCRIYAPVGTHETLLAYLVRRLLENGANSSFVNRISDPAVPVDALIADPVEEAAAIDPVGAPHPAIGLPEALFGAERRNSSGLDLSSEAVLAALAPSLIASSESRYEARPLIDGDIPAGPAESVKNPADHDDIVGEVEEATPDAIALACDAAEAGAAAWAATPPAERAAMLDRAADRYEAEMPVFLALAVREAGKTLANAVGEVREAVDFLRYYAATVRRAFANDTHKPLGPVVCISPWNFPLAIFTGQVAAALAAGNPVLAKPAGETPLIAAHAVGLLHEAGVPRSALQFLPGGGQVGAALVADPRVRGVMFTGSTEVARLIQAELAGRLDDQGRPPVLIAETGGQNALIVDSSALTEQVIADVVMSAFDSAGQRCSALRLLCVQEDAADRTLEMLRGALRELRLGNPAELATDVGPVITEKARATIDGHIAAMRARGFTVEQLPADLRSLNGTFVPPTVIEIDKVSALGREVFGPVLHVVRYRRDGLDRLLEAVNGTGYALTFGLHTRIDETVDRVTGKAAAGNIYVNRNIIGAVVGVQPFGGHGLSGTGPKAGGPLYLYRLLAEHPLPDVAHAALPPLAAAWAKHAGQKGITLPEPDAPALVGLDLSLPGPVGETNHYRVVPRGAVLCIAETPRGLALQVQAALRSGNRVLVEAGAPQDLLKGLSGDLAKAIEVVPDRSRGDAILVEGDDDKVRALAVDVAKRDGQIIPIQAARTADLDGPRNPYRDEWLLHERAISINTAAAGGNASLMSIG